MSHNLVIDLALDCPSCGTSDICLDDCICPACYLPGGFPDAKKDKSVAEWRAFAPLLAALNGEGIGWGWCTEKQYPDQIKHSVEILGIGCWVEIYRWGASYLCTLWNNTPGSRERNEAPEPQQLDEITALTDDEVVNWVTNALRYERL